MTDLRVIVRGLFRTPVFTAIAIGTLAAGIATSTSLFAIVHSVLLAPLRIPEPDGIVSLSRHGEAGVQRTFLYPEFQRFAAGSSGVVDAIGAVGSVMVRAASADDTSMARAAFVSIDYFTVVGVAPILGRAFADADHRVGAEPVVLLTNAFWRAHAHADPAIVGRTITVGDRRVHVAGLLPRGFRGLDLTQPADFFLPLATAPAVAPATNYFSETVEMIDGASYSPVAWLDLVAKLGDGQSRQRGEAFFTTTTQRSSLARRRGRIELQPAAQAALPADTRTDIAQFMRLLSMMVGLVLAVGYANFASLALARSQARRRDASIRAALGATRVDLLRLPLLESLLLGTAGSLLGLLLTVWLLGSLTRVALPGGLELGALEIDLTWRMVTFAVGLALPIAAVCGLVPSLRSLRAHAPSLARGRAGADDNIGDRVIARRAVMAAQVAISVALVIGALMFGRGLRAILTADLGLDTSRLAFASVSFLGSRYDAARATQFYRNIAREAEESAAVVQVAYGGLPLVQASRSIRAVTTGEGARVLPENVQVFEVGPEYLRALRLPLVAGRDLEARDTSGAEPVVVVSQTLARHLWPGGDALGRTLTFSPLRYAVRVIGVARDFRGIAAPHTLALYLPLAQQRGPGASFGTIVIRTSGDASTGVPLLRRLIRARDPELAIVNVSTFDAVLASRAMPQRVGTMMLGGFGLLALVLTGVGVYGLIAQSITQRQQELAIRMALGAVPGDILRLFLSGTLLPVSIGVAVGLVCARWLTGLGQQFLVSVPAFDVITFGGVAVLVLAVAVAAAALPAWSAARFAPTALLSTGARSIN